MTRVQKDHGFSLIEVVVALGILSTAAISLSTLTRGSLSGAKQIENRYLARVIADNQLARSFVEQSTLRVGLNDGTVSQMGKEFIWTRTVSPTSQEGLLAIEIQVRHVDEETVLAQVSTLKDAGL